jgi:hypothetical protein
VEGVGVEKPYYSPYIAKKKADDGWFPENILQILAYTPEGSDDTIAIPIDREGISTLGKLADEAQQRGESEVSTSWLPKPIKVDEAQ